MFVCRLFHRDRPFEPLDTRLLDEGQITLGRDSACDWPLPDADEAVSRVHCALCVEHGRLLLRDNSTNGTFLNDGERAPARLAVEIRSGESVRLGDYVVLIEAAADEGPIDPLATTITSAGPRAPVGADPTEHAPPAPVASTPRPQAADAPLLDAFCQGAGLDPSALAGEDPAEVMRRAGAIYRQTVQGLITLLAERARFKQSEGLDRTTIGASDNNPFKWTSPRRVAEELLTGGGEGFLSSAEAVTASFDDVRKHLFALSEASGAGVRAVLDHLAPDAIEAEAKAQGGLLRGRASACWEVHNRRHAELAQDGGARVAGSVADAYRRAGA